jgi:ribosomal-protein-alanine N-acetyltransferase
MRTSVSFRLMARGDLDEVLEIESRAFLHDGVWTKSDFLSSLKSRDDVSLVATVQNAVVGYVVYQVFKGEYWIFNLAVDEDFRRKGIGKAFIDRLKVRLNETDKKRIVFDLRERNLSAQLFLKSQGFKARGIERGFFEDTGEDCWQFRYSPMDEADQFWMSPYSARMVL